MDKYLVNASKIPASAMFSGFSAASIANSPSAKRGASGLSELGVNNSIRAGITFLAVEPVLMSLFLNRCSNAVCAGFGTSKNSCAKSRKLGLSDSTLQL